MLGQKYWNVVILKIENWKPVEVGHNIYIKQWQKQFKKKINFKNVQ